MADTLQDEEIFYKAKQPVQRQEPTRPVTKPAKTGYERYAEPSFIPNLEANASIWGMQPKARNVQAEPVFQPQVPSISTATRKMMSLEEVEAMMRNQSRKPATPTQLPSTSQALPQATIAPQFQRQPPPEQVPQSQHQGIGYNPPGMQFQQALQPPPFPSTVQQQGQTHPLSMGRPDVPLPQAEPQMLPRPGDMPGNRQLPSQMGLQRPMPMMQAQPRGRGPNQPQPMMQMSDEERSRFMEDEARRAKRNHKIYLLSKDNGLMTPQDKNFITRIQLQQLVTATGGVDEQGPEAALAEDFYYQVYSSLRGAPRQNPDQPLSHFAQTYLHQTGGRFGNRRNGRGGDNHMRRMEQQVQRAVEAAKAKPKNKQLVIEGSLGKISFSNSKTPKPLLNLKRNDSNDARSPKAKAADTATSRKAVLQDIETLYASLLKMEDHERRMPPPPNEESSADEFQHNMEWRQTLQELNTALWTELKVMEPIIPEYVSFNRRNPPANQVARLSRTPLLPFCHTPRARNSSLEYSARLTTSNV